MKRRTPLHTLLCTSALLLPALGVGASRPNVLFIVVDDLRPELGCYGNPIIRSPNIDRLARSGTTFDRAYCQHAVCSPSRTSLLTGARPDTTKVWDLKTHFRAALPDVVTLPQHFKANGYFVQGMGKIFHGNLNDTPSWSVPWGTPPARQYARSENTSRKKSDDASTDKPADRKAAKKAKAASGQSEAETEGSALGPVYECADVPDNTYVDGKVADLAVHTLRDLSQRSEPFFLAVGFVRPHLPWVAPKRYWDLYDPAQIALAPNPFPPIDAPSYAVNLNDGEMRQYQGVPKSGAIPIDLARQLKHGYYASVSYCDAQIGRVLDELDRLDLRRNTIVVLWGDHGWKLGEHAAWGKHGNVENDVHAPLIVSLPGMKNPGAHTDALVEFVDVYPTLAELAGLALPTHLEGTSFRPLLANPELPWKTAAFSQYPRNLAGGKHLMGYTMRTDRYRFTRWVDRNDHSRVDAVELYDHANDPQENRNIAHDPAQRETIAQLTAQWLAGWQGAQPAASSLK